jgi:hypothetical protein
MNLDMSKKIDWQGECRISSRSGTNFREAKALKHMMFLT